MIRETHGFDFVSLCWNLESKISENSELWWPDPFKAENISKNYPEEKI